jgi:chemotaxis protein histidine kinase CheA
MTRDELREKIRAAAIHFTEEVSAIFGEAFASVAAEFKSGPMELKSAPKKPALAPPAKPAKAAKQAKPAKAAKPVKPSAKPAKAAKAAKAAKPAAAAAKAKAAADKRNRRSANELVRVGDEVVKLLSTTKRSMRVEEINKQLGTNTRQLMRPIQKLISLGKIKKTGERRATLYFV